MLISVSISPDQIRYYAQSALNGFDTLEIETAIENACSELTAMLSYLDALSTADNSIPVFGLGVVNGSVGLERIGRNAEINNASDLKTYLSGKESAQLLTPATSALQSPQAARIAKA